MDSMAIALVPSFVKLTLAVFCSVFSRAALGVTRQKFVDEVERCHCGLLKHCGVVDSLGATWSHSLWKDLTCECLYRIFLLVHAE